MHFGGDSSKTSGKIVLRGAKMVYSELFLLQLIFTLKGVSQRAAEVKIHLSENCQLPSSL